MLPSLEFCVDTSPFKRQEWLPLNCCSRGGAAVASTLSTCLASESRSWTGCSVVELNGVRAPSHWLGSRPLRLRARWPSRWVVAHNGPHSNWELRTQAQPCGHKTRSDGLSAHCSHLDFGARHLRAALVRRLSELCPRVLRLLRLQSRGGQINLSPYASPSVLLRASLGGGDVDRTTRHSTRSSPLT